MNTISISASSILVEKRARNRRHFFPCLGIKLTKISIPRIGIEEVRMSFSPRLEHTGCENKRAGRVISYKHFFVVRLVSGPSLGTSEVDIWPVLWNTMQIEGFVVTWFIKRGGTQVCLFA